LALADEFGGEADALEETGQGIGAAKNAGGGGEEA
jgi:hypothetical protein